MTIGTVEASFVIFAATNVGAFIWREAIATQRAKDMAEWRTKVDKALGMNGSGPDGAYFARVEQVRALAEQLRENREASEKEFQVLLQNMRDDRVVVENRLREQSSKILGLAESFGVQFRRDTDRLHPKTGE